MTPTRWPPALLPRFLFLRHGESAANASGLVAGSWDVPLTEKGRGEARAVARLLAELPLARIVTSGLRRSRETATLIGEERGVPVHRLDGLGERHWGAFQGRPTVERPEHRLDPPGAEPWADFSARVLAALAAIEGEGPILVVAHRGVLRVIAEALGTGPGEGMLNAHPCWIDPAARAIRPFVAEPSQ